MRETTMTETITTQTAEQVLARCTVAELSERAKTVQDLMYALYSSLLAEHTDAAGYYLIEELTDEPLGQVELVRTDDCAWELDFRLDGETLARVPLSVAAIVAGGYHRLPYTVKVDRRPGNYTWLGYAPCMSSGGRPAYPKHPIAVGDRAVREQIARSQRIYETLPNISRCAREPGWWLRDCRIIATRIAPPTQGCLHGTWASGFDYDGDQVLVLKPLEA
jgi:hypothetical protein